MKKLTLVLGIVVAYFVLATCWQVGACEVGYLELREDMKDLASQLGGKVGFAPPSSDEQFREQVIHHAEKYGIELTPDEVTVERTGSGAYVSIYLAADYTQTIHLPGFSFTLHFTPTSKKG